MSQSDSPEPTRIGDYLIEGLLGAGGMAKVYRAKHSILETHHAIKVLDPEYRANADARSRFLDEAKIQAKHLDHTNIVKVTNIVATAEHAALVMELIEGPSLESHLASLKAQPAESKRIMLGILAGVGYAHKAGIIHRDLKPANVLLAKRGDELIPKVTDFGIAKVTAPDDDGKGVKKSTHSAARMGTLSYMSPEQVKRAKDATARSDVFSLGAMLYEMATGEMAFGGDSKKAVLGLVTTKRPEIEDKDALKRRIDEAAQSAPIEQLCLSPQCGFSSHAGTDRLPPGTVERKLSRVVEVAQEVWG
jgi:serine/threonine-protein kinase